MTLSAGQVSLGVSPDTRGFGQKLHDGIMGEAGGFGGIGGKIAGLIAGGIAAVGIGEGLKKVFETGFDEAKDAAAGTAQLTAGIQSTGNAANVSVEGLNNLASSIQGYSGQTDDSIVKSEQLLLTFTNIKNNGPDKIFDQATKASADMAAKFGGDASSQAVLLGKALNDPVKGITALTRVGVSFTAQQKSTIDAMVKTGDVAGAQKVILKELNTEFGGAAKAAGESFPGELQRAHRAFEDLSQGIVEKFLPIFSPAIEGIIKLMQRITPTIGDVSQKVADKAGVIGGAIKGVYDLLVKGDFTAEFRKAFHVEEDSPVVDFLLNLRDSLKQTGDFLKSSFAPIIAQIKPMFAGLAGSAGPLPGQILGLVAAFSPLHIIFTAIVPLLPVLGRAVQQLADTLLTGLVAAVVQLLPALTKIVSSILDSVIPSIVGLVHWISQNMDLVKTLAVMVLGAVVAFKAYQAVTAAVKIATQAWAAVQGLLNIVMDANPIMLIVIAIGALVAGIIWVATQTHFFQDVWKIMTDAIGAAWNWLWNSVISPVVNFIVAYFQMLGAIATWLWANAIQPAINGIGAAFNWIWNNVIAPIGQWIGGAIQNIGDTVSNVFGAIGGTIRSAFDGVVGFIRGVINQVIDVVNGAIGSINGIAGAVKDATGGAIDVHLNTIPHLATGGTIRTPGTALVGENGPEIVSLPAGATVYPTGTGPGSSGGTTFNIYEAVNATATAQTVMQRLTARKV